MLTDNLLRNRAEALSEPERALLESAMSETKTYVPGFFIAKRNRSWPDACAVKPVMVA